jgi:hypothetical protein
MSLEDAKHEIHVLLGEFTMIGTENICPKKQRKADTPM